MANGKQSLNEPHKVLVSKCQGYLDRSLKFGEWAYWHPNGGMGGGGKWMPNPPEGMTHDEVPDDKTPIHQ